MFSPSFRLFCRQPPGKKPSCVRKSQRQKIARQRVAGPNSPSVPSQCRIFRCGCSSPSVPSCPMAENARKIGVWRISYERPPVSNFLAHPCTWVIVCADGQRMALGGRFSGEGMAIFLRFFPAGPSLEDFELELILCETQLRQKIAASENHSVRKSHVRESQDRKEAFKLILCQSLVFVHFRLFSRKLPQKNQLRQKIVASERRTSESRRTKKGLQAHPLSIAKLEIV